MSLSKRAKIVLDDEQVHDLIREIKARESLLLTEKNNPHVQGPTWKAVGEKLSISCKVLKNKWNWLKKKMRETLAKNLSDEDSQADFEYYLEMLFAKDYLLKVKLDEEVADRNPDDDLLFAMEKAGPSKDMPSKMTTRLSRKIAPPKTKQSKKTEPPMPSKSNLHANFPAPSSNSIDELMKITDEEYMNSMLPLSAVVDDDLEKLWVRIKMLELLAYYVYGILPND